MNETLHRVKRDILQLCYRAGTAGAHLGGCLSMAEIMTVLYTKHLRFRPNAPLWEERDRFVLSKGHGGIAQYAAMHAAGILTDEEFSKPLLGEDTILYKHPQRNASRGIEFTGGSLGLGLPFAIGEALALLRKGNSASRIYCLIGDGELNEGSIWEALSVAGHFQLPNFTVIVDANGLQLSGTTKEVQSIPNIAERLKSFGFDAQDVDGHDLDALDAAFTAARTGLSAIVAHTQKGHGVSFAADNVNWHSKALDSAHYEMACRELGVEL